MTNAQDWLNQKLPSQELKENVKVLSITGRNAIIYSLDGQTIYSGSVEDLTGELDLSALVNLQSLTIFTLPNLTAVRGVEKLTKLFILRIDECPHLKPIFTFLEAWKREVEQLKRQLEEYENDTASQVSSESSYSDLEAKIRQKEQELANTRDTSRRSTAPLRKEIELLKKLLGFENKIRELEAREQGCQQQLAQKETVIQQKQQQINTLQQSERVDKQKIQQLEQQITNLNQEKTALQERMLAERQEALREWKREKNELQNSLTQLKDHKDTFQKSADYLRETLKSAEKGLEEIKEELKTVQEELEAEKKEKATALESHQTELKNRSEAYGVIQERNQELEKKLSGAQSEISQLTTWIGKLESVSGEGNALELLKKELAQAQDTIADLTEQLTSKKPRSYWWIYVVIALVGLYLVMG